MTVPFLDQAHLFNQYTHSLFTRDSSSTSFTALDLSQSSKILENMTDIYNALTNLNQNNAQGIDRISPKVWK